jgi:hypothetical protein
MASTTTNKHPFLLAAAVAHGVLALGHTVRSITKQYRLPAQLTVPVDKRSRPIQTPNNQHPPHRPPRRRQSRVVRRQRILRYHG